MWPSRFPKWSGLSQDRVKKEPLLLKLPVQGQLKTEWMTSLSSHQHWTCIKKWNPRFLQGIQTISWRPPWIQGIPAMICPQLCLLLQGQERGGNLLQIPKDCYDPHRKSQVRLKYFPSHGSGQRLISVSENLGQSRICCPVLCLVCSSWL